MIISNSSSLTKKVARCMGVILFVALTGCSALKDSLNESSSTKSVVQGPTGNVGAQGPQGATGNTGIQGPQGPEGPRLTGNWVGYVVLFDTAGRPLSDKSGVTVTVSNPSTLSTASLSSPKQSTTDANGKFVISNLTTGIYTLTFSKPGYGDMKYYNYQFIGDGDVLFAPANGLYNYVNLVQKSAFEVVSANVTVTGNYYFDFRCKTNLTPDTFGSDLRFVRIFVGYQDNVSSDSSTYFYSDTARISSVDENGEATVSFYVSSDSILPKGTMLYGSIYSATPTYVRSVDGSYFPAGFYVDPVQNKTIFTTLGTQRSPAAAFSL